MIHDPKSLVIALAITAAMLLAGLGFVVYGLVMAMGGLWL